MSDQNKYPLPDYIAKNLAEGGDLSGSDMQLAETIFNTASGYQYPKASTAAQWEKLKSKIQEPAVPAFPLQKTKNTRLIPFSIRWAAAAAIVLALTIGLWRFNTTPVKENTVVYNAVEQVKEIQLSDGSSVKLNKNSSLEVSDFNGPERIVALKGEAYFSVSHNGKPFTVNTSKGSVQVLGTEFNIRDRAEGVNDFSVALATGKIAFTPKHGQSVTMKPGELIVQVDKNAFRLEQVKPTTFSWADQKLIFENERLETIIKALEEQYNVKFAYDESLKDEKLTLTFSQLTVDQAADLLSKTLNSKVTIK